MFSQACVYQQGGISGIRSLLGVGMFKGGWYVQVNIQGGGYVQGVGMSGEWVLIPLDMGPQGWELTSSTYIWTSGEILIPTH